MAGRTRRSVRRPLAFWDASALVPLCVRQSNTPRSIELYENYEAVVWWATPVEISSALARLVRMKQLDSNDWVKSRRLLADLAQEWSLIQPSDALRLRAIGLVDRYEVRAADALQLAAALEWCEGVSEGKVFFSADQKLRSAAVLNGFDAELI